MAQKTEFDPIQGEMTRSSKSTDSRLLALEEYSPAVLADGATLTGTTAETTIGTLSILKIAYPVAGRSICIWIAGRYSTTALGGNLTIRIKRGATVLADFGAIALGSIIQTNKGWIAKMIGTVRTAGASGTLATNSSIFIDSGGQRQLANITSKTFDTTTDTALTVTAQLSDTNSSLTLEQLIASELNS